MKHSKNLKNMLRMNVVVGGLMLLPLIMSVKSDNVFNVSIANNPTVVATVFGLIVWTMCLTWFFRLREIESTEVKASILIIIAGLVNITFFIATELGLGGMSIALAPTLPFLFSHYHVSHIKLAMQDLNKKN